MIIIFNVKKKLLMHMIKYNVKINVNAYIKNMYMKCMQKWIKYVDEWNAQTNDISHAHIAHKHTLDNIPPDTYETYKIKYTTRR